VYERERGGGGQNKEKSVEIFLSALVQHCCCSCGHSVEEKVGFFSSGCGKFFRRKKEIQSRIRKLFQLKKKKQLEFITT